jgi:ubiquitin-protein ligase E3 B
MFSTKKDDDSKRDAFLKQAEDARLKRQLEKRKLQSAIKIQCVFRSYVARKRVKQSIEHELQKEFGTGSATLRLTSLQLFDLTQKFLFLNKKLDSNKQIIETKILQNICENITQSILTGDFKHSYVSLIISKENYQNFLSQSHKLLKFVLNTMNSLKIKEPNEKKLFTNIITMLGTFCDSKAWFCFHSVDNELMRKVINETSKGFLLTLSKNAFYQIMFKILIQNSFNYQPLLQNDALTTVLNLVFKILAADSANNSPTTLFDFCSFVMTIPTLFSNSSNLKQLLDQNLTKKILIMFDSNCLRDFTKDKDINCLLCFLGNLCTLCKLDFNTFRLCVDQFLQINTHIFSFYYETAKQSKSSSSEHADTIRWHPIFGFLKLKSSVFTNYEIMIDVLNQLRFLWSHQFISILFDNKNQICEAITKSNFKDFMKQFFEQTLSLNRQVNAILNEKHSIYGICSFYRQLLMFFSEPRIEILSALSVEEELLLGLWRFMMSLGPQLGLYDLTRLVEMNKSFEHQVFDLLYLISSLVLYLATVLDENEFYTKQQIFKLNDYKQLASFLNNFLFKVVGNELVDAKSIEHNPYFHTFHQLLIILYTKDTRRSFTNECDSFWLIKDLKLKQFMSDLDKEKLSAKNVLQYMPHVIPLKSRIEILKIKIEKDKRVLFGSMESPPQVRLNIRRNKLIEDAYTNLHNLPMHLFKSTIRVCFLNDFGLKEAGIDQDGVFKEFLLDVIKQLFDPKFNLFKVTENEQQLYPSPCSYYVEDHLQMIEFAGRLIGKAVYECQVVDTQFAPFFLRQLTGFKSQNYSFLDDLAALDQDLYRNLNLIKYEDCVSDLELTFTHSEMHLGQLVTHDLVPSGNLIRVTNENKIKYIHLLAHFKLFKQIKDQVKAFNNGFKSVIKQEWLNMFSVPEIQRLISGCSQDINLEDLKRNVQYLNGLHSNHRLIKWLWEILENDFNREERALFLKFVTSSPKPPLLGFSSLNPPFSIRVVESEEEDSTVYDASIKSFFKTVMNLGGTDTSRLPTSSTCFNLLKLPNYSKKSSLKEKLRYAIKSNSGFELS